MSQCTGLVLDINKNNAIPEHFTSLKISGVCVDNLRILKITQNFCYIATSFRTLSLKTEFSGLLLSLALLRDLLLSLLPYVRKFLKAIVGLKAFITVFDIISHLKL